MFPTNTQYSCTMMRALIAGMDSAIGSHVSKYLAANSWEICSTTRKLSYVNDESVFYCDFTLPESIDECTSKIRKVFPEINLLVIAIGLMNPIGNFGNCEFNQWEKTFYVNCTGPLRFINRLLPCLRMQENSMVLTFAGGAVNSAPKFYTSYNLSKISLVKSMELLSGEESKIKFISLGTGWINTPIHLQTINAKESLGESEILAETERRYMLNEFVNIDSINDFIKWSYFDAPLSISGRNFSLVNDNWRSGKLIDALNQDPNMYKLRRFKNDEKI